MMIDLIFKIIRALSAVSIILIALNSSLSSASDYGVKGLIDTPSARMNKDGSLSTGTSWESRTKSFNLTYQITPWLEGTFRYTGFNDFFFWDRNFEVKTRLIEETERFPQIALGIRDIAGTGVFGSEYLVASKRFGNYDISLGMGWGRLAGEGDIKNPLTVFSDRFNNRKNFSGLGGEFSFDTFFTGQEVGIFGGLIYENPRIPLTFILEYNPDQYYREQRRGAPEPKSPISAALKWDFNPNMSVTISRQHQEDWGINFTASLDTKRLPKRPPEPEFISSLSLKPNELPSVINPNRWYDMLLYDVERSKILLLEASIDEESRSATLVMGNLGYVIWSDALATMINLADIHLPNIVDTLNIVIEEDGHRLQTISVTRSSISFDNSRDAIQNEIQIAPVKKQAFVQHRTNFYQRKIFYDYSLAVRTQLFDPDDPLRYQLYGKIGMRMSLPNNWLIRGVYSQNIYQNFDESRRKSNSKIQHVRTDIVEYLTEGESGLDSFFIEKKGNIASDIYYRAYGGLLEYMYSGLGFELLYHPFQSRLSYGFSSNLVKQRDYDKSFKHLSYSTTTAFASVYWASPFYNLDFAIHAGKYLAKDVGTTLEVRRTFNNGWMVGLWATKTDVSAADFGEGSFDKGMFFRVPVNNFLDKGSSRSSLSTHLRPIQRDGGQRLEDFSGNIWWDIRNASYDAFMKTKNKKFFAGFSTKKKTSTKQNVLKKYYNEK